MEFDAGRIGRIDWSRKRLELLRKTMRSPLEQRHTREDKILLARVFDGAGFVQIQEVHEIRCGW